MPSGALKAGGMANISAPSISLTVAVACAEWEEIGFDCKVAKLLGKSRGGDMVMELVGSVFYGVWDAD